MTKPACEHCGEPMTGLRTLRFCKRLKCLQERAADANRRHREDKRALARARRQGFGYQGDIARGRVWTLDRIIHAND